MQMSAGRVDSKTGHAPSISVSGAATAHMRLNQRNLQGSPALAATEVWFLAMRGSHAQDARCSPPATLRVPCKVQLRPIKGCTPGSWPKTAAWPQTPNTANPADALLSCSQAVACQGTKVP